MIALKEYTGYLSDGEWLCESCAPEGAEEVQDEDADRRCDAMIQVGPHATGGAGPELRASLR